MKLITFTTAGFSRIGALVDGEKVVDLNYAYQAQLQSEGKYRYEAIAEAYVPAKMEGFLEGGQGKHGTCEVSNRLCTWPAG